MPQLARRRWLAVKVLALVWAHKFALSPRSVDQADEESVRTHLALVVCCVGHLCFGLGLACCADMVELKSRTTLVRFGIGDVSCLAGFAV